MILVPYHRCIVVFSSNKRLSFFRRHSANYDVIVMYVDVLGLNIDKKASIISCNNMFVPGFGLGDLIFGTVWKYAVMDISPFNQWKDIVLIGAYLRSKTVLRARQYALVRHEHFLTITYFPPYYISGKEEGKSQHWPNIKLANITKRLLYSSQTDVVTK